MQLQTQTGQHWFSGTSQLHLCSRRTSEGNGTHCTRTLVGPQRHVADSEGKSLFFPIIIFCYAREERCGSLMGLDLSGATLSCIFKMDFSLRQKGLNQTKMLQAKLRAVFNYFRGLKCSQMSLWRSQALYQKQVPGGLSQYRACCVNFRG